MWLLVLIGALNSCPWALTWAMCIHFYTVQDNNQAAEISEYHVSLKVSIRVAITSLHHDKQDQANIKVTD